MSACLRRPNPSTPQHETMSLAGLSSRPQATLSVSAQLDRPSMGAHERGEFGDSMNPALARVTTGALAGIRLR